MRIVPGIYSGYGLFGGVLEEERGEFAAVGEPLPARVTQIPSQHINHLRDAGRGDFAKKCLTTF